MLKTKQNSVSLMAGRKNLIITFSLTRERSLNRKRRRRRAFWQQRNKISKGKLERFCKPAGPAFPPKQQVGEVDLWAGPEDREGGVLSRDGTRGVGVSQGRAGLRPRPSPFFSPWFPPGCVSPRSRQAQRLRESRESGRWTSSEAGGCWVSMVVKGGRLSQSGC